MGRKKIIETDKERKLRFEGYQQKYYANPINRQTVYQANQRTQAERFKRWYSKQTTATKNPMIIQLPAPIYYTCNNQIFYNVYAANYESMTSGKPIGLYCYDDDYKQLDWTQEPEQSFDELMGIHAHNLRNKYERLIFMWSGGTDSHTIYNIFEANNIHIDEIIIKHSEEAGNGYAYPTWHVDWLMKNHYDPTTKITVWNEYDTNIRGLVVANDNWMMETKGDLLRLGQSAMSSANIELCERTHNGYNWGIVMGLEKPTVKFIDGQYYSFQVDKFVRQAMGHANVECFFLEPMINLKQSHLAKRALKTLASSPIGPKNYGVQRETRQDSVVYTAWARAVGRHKELTLGSSFAQKTALAPIFDTRLSATASLEDFTHATGEPMLAAKLKLQDPVAINYTRGLFNIRSDEKFYKFLNENTFVKQDSILNLKDVLTVPYCLGE